jgi:hypothetical protein
MAVVLSCAVEYVCSLGFEGLHGLDFNVDGDTARPDSTHCGIGNEVGLGHVHGRQIAFLIPIVDGNLCEIVSVEEYVASSVGFDDVGPDGWQHDALELFDKAKEEKGAWLLRLFLLYRPDAWNLGTMVVLVSTILCLCHGFAGNLTVSNFCVENKILVLEADICRCPNA